MPAKYHNAIPDYPQTIQPLRNGSVYYLRTTNRWRWMRLILAKYHNAIPDYPQTIRGWCSIPPKTQMQLAPNASQVPQCYSRLPTNYTDAYNITESSLQSLCKTFLSIIYLLLTAGGGWCSIPPKTRMQLAPNASQVP
ncbi:uncharacterized protein BDR25DRAFT_363131 [Lindgomyces ingoldianus]|uniref:Uncharacterized protein n=1 Tax=Lindgomyces ingoldianus TaxID=673940 RepID=A0ACB6Q856_9PLEO|nr:uncharacterized protein BDR25DRAFT_363131 [Lindgomyces ingoldianus]KAF2463046.1 hypothetical protein BDR25DRAFT_363131 [Lindgomyces ingoldianus]